MVALRIPHPDAFRSRHVEIPIPVYFHSVGYAVAFATGLSSEDAAICQRAVGPEAINANISLLAVIDVKTLSIGGEGQPVGLGQIFCQQLHFVIRIEAIHTLERNLLPLSLRQIESRVGEIDRTVRTNDDVVRAIEVFPLVAVGQDLVFAIRLDLDDGAQNARTVQQMYFRRGRQAR